MKQSRVRKLVYVGWQDALKRVLESCDKLREAIQSILTQYGDRS